MAPDTAHPQITYFEELKRKGIHLSSLWMVVAIILIPDWRITAAIFAVLLVITLLFEHAYACNWPVMGPMYGFFFRKMLRKPPAPGAWIVSGGAYVLAAALLVVILYAPPAAAGALAVMLTGDAAAALIGRRFGRHRAPNNKSWEGVAAFLLVGGGVLALYLASVGAPPRLFLAGTAAIIPACAAELFEKQLHIDDNFSIPVIIGFGLQLGLWTQNA